MMEEKTNTINGHTSASRNESTATCNVCFHRCVLKEGQTGFCHARRNTHGEIIPVNYGQATSLALDPIEKKPLHRFHPGSKILSYGSFGCNLRCPFCQNSDISMYDPSAAANEAFSVLEKSHTIVHPSVLYGSQSADRASSHGVFDYAEDDHRFQLLPLKLPGCRFVSPDALVSLAASLSVEEGNIGIAFTYNEPLISWEYIRDVSVRSHAMGLLNVLVTNGTASLPILREILPCIDAMNIDLKGIRPSYYSETLGGNLPETEAFIREAVQHCHVELTTLIVPGENDTDEEMAEITDFISGLSNVYGGKTGADVPLHVSRFFPRYHMMDREATDVDLVYHLADLARRKLHYVYTGNC